MSSLPLGLGAYKRTAGDMPEIKCVNRFVEKTPVNQQEGTTLLTRPGTSLLDFFAADTDTGKIRGVYSELGLFNDDLFVVSGKYLYRKAEGSDPLRIGGEVKGTGSPKVAFVKGADYARLFITDDLLFNYYQGGTHASGTMTDAAGTHATGTLTDAGSTTYTDAVLDIGGIYYGWNSDVDHGTPDGTSANPYLCLPGADATAALANMAAMLNFDGTAGTDFSTALTAASTTVTATSTATTLTLTAISGDTDGNSVVTSVTGAATLSWSGTTLSGGGTNYTDAVIAINGTYYGWNDDVDDGTPDGSSDNPFFCLPGDDASEALANMAAMLNFEGTAGTDFSTALTTANLDVSASSTATTLVVTARVDSAAGNLITTTVSGEANLSWGAATLADGGTHSMHGISIPNGQGVVACASLDGYVFVACKDSQRFYLLKPGEVEIDPLDFFSKESHPDNIVDVVRVGDVMVIMGNSSTEFWGATGNADAPFAPIEGRTMSRGIIPGTAVMVNEGTIIVVGNDMRVYAIGDQPRCISDHSMEERIRRQLRYEAGLTS
jgi:hypothetical protein